MSRISALSLIILGGLILSGCDNSPSSQACLGKNNDSLVEGMKDQCKAGDIVATKHSAYFCDFEYSVAYNKYNSAICVYTGSQADERTLKK